jgi:hypothetical protein
MAPPTEIGGSYDTYATKEEHRVTTPRGTNSCARTRLGIRAGRVRRLGVRYGRAGQGRIRPAGKFVNLPGASRNQLQHRVGSDSE